MALMAALFTLMWLYAYMDARLTLGHALNRPVEASEVVPYLICFALYLPGTVDRLARMIRRRGASRASRTAGE